MIDVMMRTVDEDSRLLISAPFIDMSLRLIPSFVQICQGSVVMLLGLWWRHAYKFRMRRAHCRAKILDTARLLGSDSKTVARHYRQTTPALPSGMIVYRVLSSSDVVLYLTHKTIITIRWPFSLRQDLPADDPSKDRHPLSSAI
jgi:hypothetical protein